MILCSPHPSGEGPRPGLARTGRGSGAPRSTPMHTWTGSSRGQGHGAARTTGRGPKNHPQEKSHGCRTTSTWVTQPPTPAGVGTQGGTVARARIWRLGEGDGGNSALAFQEPAAPSPACKQRAGLKDKQTNRGEPIWGQPERSDSWQGVLLLKCLFQGRSAKVLHFENAENERFGVATSLCLPPLRPAPGLHRSDLPRGCTEAQMLLVGSEVPQGMRQLLWSCRGPKITPA